MGSFIIYKKLSAPELRKIARDGIKGIKGWFDANPKRRVCHAELWHGIQCTVTRKNVEQVVNKHLEEAIGDSHEASS